MIGKERFVKIPRERYQALIRFAHALYHAFDDGAAEDAQTCETTLDKAATLAIGAAFEDISEDDLHDWQRELNEAALGDDEGSAHFADDAPSLTDFIHDMRAASRVTPIREPAGVLDLNALQIIDAIVLRGPTDPNFLAGAHLVAADFQRSLSGKQMSAEDAGAIAINMQLLAEKVARLYAGAAA